uniref:Myosin-10-like isoform X2 n=1 Tax=Elaeis guineensis var. tenera TaxID=51953 RepID=A0A8N4EV61_ELAGV|nr:myosin-10-like isoform X2 [Elaeis guineensis]
MADTGPGSEKESSSEKAVPVTESEVTGLDVPEEDSRALHSQPASMPVSHAVTESEGTGIGGRENIADESQKTKSEAIKKESQVNNDVNEPSTEEQNSADETLLLLVRDEDQKLELEAATVEVSGAQQKLKDPLDEKQAVNESTTKASSTLQDNNDSMGLTEEGQEEEVTDAEVLKEECQAPQNQPEYRSVSHAVIETEGSEIGSGESVADKCTQNTSETIENESQANNDSKELSPEAKDSPDENILLLVKDEDPKPELDAVATGIFSTNAEVVKEDCQVLQNQPEGTLVSHSETELESSETGQGQEGMMQPQLSSSEKSGDITVVIEKQQNDEQIIDELQSEVKQLEAINSRLWFEAAEVSGRLGDAQMNLDRLKKILKDKDVAQECMSSAVVAHALKNQTATKDAEDQTLDTPSEIKAKEAESSILACKKMNAEIKYLVETINRQKQEIDSLSKNNDELLKRHDGENAKNEKIEEMLKNHKERMIEDQKVLYEANCDKHKVVKLMEEQRSVMKCVAESNMASLSDALQTLETVFEEHCKAIQRQLSNCTEGIQMVLSLLRGNKSTTDENDRLIIKFLSTYIVNVVLHDTNRKIKERLEEDERLLEKHSQSQHKLERLKNKVVAREKELAARGEKMDEDINQLNNAVNYYRERFDQLYNNYYGREGRSAYDLC